ncbi:hypothetical protein DV735_g4878, partial [Chaetothyriales sp. CBS 134920]
MTSWLFVLGPEHERPDVHIEKAPRLESTPAQKQGRPGLAATRIFSAWAQLPISQDAYLARQKELQAAEFTFARRPV